MSQAFPPIKVKVEVDDTQLKKASVTSAATGAAISGHMKASTTHTLGFVQSLTTMTDHLGGLPPIVSTAGRSLESMATKGVTGMTLIGGAAVAGFGLVTAAIGESIKKYEEIGSQVENYHRIVGGSVEESGRMVQTFNALGVSGDTATTAMFKFSQAIDLHPAKLRALGVEIAHDAAGNVDLSATLFNLSDRYNAMSSQVDKNNLLFTAFGRAGKDMIPVLEQGSKALQALEASARLTFTQDDIDRLKRLKIQQAEVKQGWDAMWESMGQKLMPAQEALSTSMLKHEYILRRLSEAQRDGDLQARASAGERQKLIVEFGAQYDAAQKVRAATDTMAQASRDHAAAMDAEWTAMDTLISHEENQVNASLALQRADLTRAEAAGKADKAAEAYDLAVKQFGINSDEAVLAHNQYERALIDQEDAFYKDAAAARKLQEDTDMASTGQKNAALDAQVYIDKLQAEADTLSPTNPLRVRLQAYIDFLKNQIPKTVDTTIGYTIVGPSGRAQGGAIGLNAYAEGGRPQVGVPAIIGDKGPEIWTPDRPGTITPFGQAPPAPRDGGDMLIHQTTEIPLYLDGTELGRVIDRRMARILAATSNA